MRYNSDGRPDENGLFELIDGRLTLCQGQMEEGQRIGFDRVLMDAVTGGGSSFRDAKADDPKSIDEALQQAFAAAALTKGKKVSEWLATATPKQIDEIVAAVATAFVRGHAGAGIAKKFAKDTAMISDAERDYAVRAARAKHNLRYGHMGAGAPAFTDAMAQAASADAVAARVAERAQVALQAADRLNDADYQEGMEIALRVTRKHIASNAWRR